MIEKIIDKNLSRIVKVKLCTDEINSVEEIEDICIQDMNFVQRRQNIDLTEIVKMKKLKNLSLKFFEITDVVVDTINQLEFIERIEFSMCTFNTNKILSRNLKELIIYNCTNFDINILNKHTPLEVLELVHSGMVNIDKLNSFKNLKRLKLAQCNIITIPSISIFENLERLYLNNAEIQYDIDISRMKKLKFISLNGSNVQNKDIYIQRLYEQNNNLKIEFEEDNLPIE